MELLDHIFIDAHSGTAITVTLTKCRVVVGIITRGGTREQCLWCKGKWAPTPLILYCSDNNINLVCQAYYRC